MAGIYNGPARGGTRGGKDQFSWDNVKADASREYYLGHSVKALTGRWQKGKDVYWYTREKDDEGDVNARRAAEMDAVKQREHDLMMEALGITAPAGDRADKEETHKPGEDGDEKRRRKEEKKERKRRHKKERHRSRSRSREKKSKRRHYSSSDDERGRELVDRRDKDRKHRRRSRSR